MGTRTIIPIQGDRPALRARRTLIPTATHRNGSVQKKKAHCTQSGTGGVKNCCRRLRSGFRKSSGEKNRPERAHRIPASTAYLNISSPKPVVAYACRLTSEESPNHRESRLLFIGGESSEPGAGPSGTNVFDSAMDGSWQRILRCEFRNRNRVRTAVLTVSGRDCHRLCGCWQRQASKITDLPRF